MESARFKMKGDRGNARNYGLRIPRRSKSPSYWQPRATRFVKLRAWATRAVRQGEELVMNEKGLIMWQRGRAMMHGGLEAKRSGRKG